MKSKAIILDTNYWISFLITKDYAFIDRFIHEGRIKLIFSDEIIEEFISVVLRPKFKRYFSDDDIQDLLKIFDLYGKRIKVKTNLHICRDSKDNFLLNLAVDSKANYLVTGDTDLLSIGNIRKTKIVTMGELLNKLN